MDTISLTQLAKHLKQYQNTKDSPAWKELAKVKIKELLQLLPSGKGLDSGVEFNWQKSQPNKLMFSFGFHHMNSNGYYTGWTLHNLIITPDFATGFNLKITGKDKNNVKEHLYTLFDECFRLET